jgi:hypothetical protein
VLIASELDGATRLPTTPGTARIETFFPMLTVAVL